MGVIYDIFLIFIHLFIVISILLPLPRPQCLLISRFLRLLLPRPLCLLLPGPPCYFLPRPPGLFLPSPLRVLLLVLLASSFLAMNLALIDLL